MADINTEHMQKCIEVLEKSYEMLNGTRENTTDYEMYRNSLVKSFEMTLEISAKLLKKKITPYFASKRAVDMLSFKDIFRYAHKYSMLNDEETNRWMRYRDNRNNTAHDYGIAFATETLALINDFLRDVKNLKKVLDNG